MKFKALIKREYPNHRIVTAANGLAALDEVGRQQFDLVITDYRMPETDGLELLAAIRQMPLDMPVIMITANGDETLKRMARQAGVLGLLSKPTDVANLRRIMGEALGDGK